MVDCGFLLISAWALVSIFGVFYYMDDPNKWTLTPIPFLYLFGVFLLFTRMFIFSASKWDNAMGDFVFKRSQILDVLCIFFILFSIFNILNTDFSVSSMSFNDIEKHASDNYSNHIDHYGEKGYSNFLERITLNYCSWFKMAALICMYMYLCQRRKTFAGLLAICIFLPTFMSSVMRGTRGTLVTEILLFVSAFLLFKRFIPQNTKKSIYAYAGVVGAISLLFLIAVTNSRFSDSTEGAGGSVLAYFGQSMLFFDNGLADSVEGMLYGIRTFKTIYSFWGISLPDGFKPDLFLGTNIGTGFVTFIGMLILDFGFLGTAIVGLIVPWFIQSLCSYRKSFTMASLYLFLFFLNRMILGVFTNASGVDFDYIIAVLFYFVFRIAFDTKVVSSQK